MTITCKYFYPLRYKVIAKGIFEIEVARKKYF